MGALNNKPGKGGKRKGSGRKRMLPDETAVTVGVRVPASLVQVFKIRVKELLSRLIAEAKSPQQD